ncbi:unnamed protein product [Meloidogyne enterolobii]|uniref:Uncharacterized protein n=1 Tax=Meloidogyne enterolobii TaxID=390850 RepID=A0ACB1AJA0_MELEN
MSTTLHFIFQKKVTTTAIIIKPSTAMNSKPKVGITTKIHKITPIPKKTKTTRATAVTTYKPRSSTAFAPIDQCKLFNDAELIERYACNCADLSMRELNACCENYHKCLSKINDIINNNCTFSPNMYYISINVSNYNWTCNECVWVQNRHCQYQQCKCDKQVIECWSRIPAPKHNKNESVSCEAKFIDEVKDNPNIPIANVTNIRRNNDKSWEKLDKIEKEIETLKHDRPMQKFLVKTQQAAIKYSDEIDLAYDKMNSTLYEAIFKLNEAINKAEKSNDEEDLVEVEIALDEFSKTLQAAVTFDNEYQWAYTSILTVHLKIDMIVDLATGKVE